MFPLYKEAKEWVQTFWNKDKSFNTRLRLVTGILLIELIELIRERVGSIEVVVVDEAESKTE